MATDDGTVIITSVNEAWAEPGSLLDLFREGFKNGEGTAHLLNHTLIVAVDPGALARCEAVHPHCYLLEVTSANVTSANRFMTKSYLELVWAKLELQQRVLELGYNYLFTVRSHPATCMHASKHALFFRSCVFCLRYAQINFVCRMWISCGCATRSGTSASTPT